MKKNSGMGLIIAAALVAGLVSFPNLGHAAFIDFDTIPETAGTVSHAGGITDLIGPGPFAGSPNLSFILPSSFTLGGAFTSTAALGQIANGDTINSPIPEAASLILLGSGLAGLGLWGWKRRREEHQSLGLRLVH